MPYPTRLLNDDETVVLDFHPHWSFFAKSVAALVGSIVLGIIALSLDDGDTKDVLSWVALVLIVVTAVWVVVRYAKWITSNFVITSDRIIYRAGFISKHGIDIPLERVNTIKMRQGAFERMLGAGDLMIESGGETGQQRFTDIRGPERVQRLIYAQMDLNDDRGAPAPGVDGADLTSQLERLEGMLQRGTLTPEEFESQKRRLLG